MDGLGTHEFRAIGGVHCAKSLASVLAALGSKEASGTTKHSAVFATTRASQRPLQLRLLLNPTIPIGPKPLKNELIVMESRPFASSRWVYGPCCTDGALSDSVAPLFRTGAP